jgi:TolB protein
LVTVVLTKVQRSAFTAAAVALVCMSAGGATASPTGFPGHNGRIVVASARIDKPGELSQILSLSLVRARIRNLSRSSSYDDSAPLLSPDGSRFAFLRAPFWTAGSASLWLMNRNGSHQRRIAAADPDSDLAWSPDGKQVAFTAPSETNASSLWVVNTDGSGLHELTDFFVSAPQWSPDGSKIVFAGLEHGAPLFTPHIGLINADGSGLRWLTRYGDLDTEPAWSPDGQEVVFVREERLPTSGETYNLVLIHADGTGERRLTPFTDDVPLGSPRWSPSGTQITFLRPAPDGAVEVVRPDGTGLHILARHALPPLVWSPSGDQIAFARGLARRGSEWFELVVKPLHGAEHIYPLPGHLARGGLTGGPLWSPDGRGLFFAGVLAARHLELYSIGAQGRGLRQLTRDSVDDFDPAWSPDGRRIAFVRGRLEGDLLQGVGGVEKGSLYVIRSDGRHMRRVTSGRIDTLPSWAPDGVRIVFARGPNGLAVVNTRTRRVRSLPYTGSDPAWSPDGRLIAFASGPLLDVGEPSGRTEQTIFDGTSQAEGVPAEISRPSWSPDGRSIAFHLLYDHGRWTDESDAVVSRAGRNEHTLSCEPATPPPPALEYLASRPARISWSPDGTWIAAVQRTGGRAAVAVCRVDGSSSYWLTPGEEADWQALRAR